MAQVDSEGYIYTFFSIIIDHRSDDSAASKSEIYVVTTGHGKLHSTEHFIK